MFAPFGFLQSFNGEDARSTHQHQDGGHRQSLTVVKRTGLGDIAIDGYGEGGVIGPD